MCARKISVTYDPADLGTCTNAQTYGSSFSRRRRGVRRRTGGGRRVPLYTRSSFSQVRGSVRRVRLNRVVVRLFPLKRPERRFRCPVLNVPPSNVRFRRRDARAVVLFDLGEHLEEPRLAPRRRARDAVRPLDVVRRAVHAGVVRADPGRGRARRGVRVGDARVDAPVGRRRALARILGVLRARALVGEAVARGGRRGRRRRRRGCLPPSGRASPSPSAAETTTTRRLARPRDARDARERHERSRGRHHARGRGRRTARVSSALPHQRGGLVRARRHRCDAAAVHLTARSARARLAFSSQEVARGDDEFSRREPKRECGGTSLVWVFSQDA